MNRHAPFQSMRLRDRGLQLVVRDLVRLRGAARIREPSRDAYLDDVRSAADLFLDSRAERIGATHTEAIELAGAVLDAYPAASGEHPRSDDVSCIDVVAQPQYPCVGCAEILNRRETGFNGGSRIRRRRAAKCQMDMRIDQAGQKRDASEIDALDVRGKPGVRIRTGAGVRNSAVRHDDNRPFHGASFAYVQERSGVNRDGPGGLCKSGG